MNINPKSTTRDLRITAISTGELRCTRGRGRRHGDSGSAGRSLRRRWSPRGIKKHGKTQGETNFWGKSTWMFMDVHGFSVITFGIDYPNPITSTHSAYFESAVRIL